MATRQIKTQLSLSGEKQWRAEMQSVNSQLKTLRSELNLSTSEFRGQANTMAALTAKQQVLQKQYDQQKEKVRALKDALEQASKIYEKSPEKIDMYQRQLNAATVQLHKMGDELGENTRLVYEASKSQDKCAHSIDGFGKEIKEAGDQALTFGDLIKANVISDSIVAGLKKLCGAMKAIGDEFAHLAMESVNLASDLGEVQNVVETTFGAEGAQKIYDWAGGAAEAYGLSRLSAEQYVGTLGAMLKSMGLSEDATLDMSLAMVGLAGDMASFYNLDPQEAFDKLRAGISGETEPLKQLGINMSVANLEAYALSQGIETAYGSMTQAEQATLRYNYLMQATSDAQGDFAKTSDSYANQQRILELNIENLKTSLGEQLLPAFTEVTSAFNDFLTGQIDFTEFIDRLLGINSVTEAFGALTPVIAAGTAALIAYKAASAINGVIDALKVATESQTIAQVALNAVMNANPFVLVATLIAGVTAALLTLWTTNEDFRAAVTSAWNRLCDAVTWVCDKIRGAFDAVGDKFREIKNKFMGFLSDFKDIGWNIVSGIWDGISGGYEWITGKIQGWVGDVLGFFKSILGIHSPSTVLRDQVGKYMGEGVTEGFIGGIDEDAMRDAIPTSFDIAAEVHTANGSGISNVGAVPYSNGGLQSAPHTYEGFLRRLDEIEADLRYIRQHGSNLVLDDGTIVGRWAPMMDRELGKLAKDKERGT